MRFVLVNPRIFTALLQGPESQRETSNYLILAVANGALADYAVESRARPPGVAPELQTTSYSARKAIADELKSGGMQAHHLVPAEVWGKYKDIAALAYKAGWRPDQPSNLIALPANEAEFDREGKILPKHFGSHPIYSADTVNDVASFRSDFPANLTPLEARAILESTALKYRFRIISHAYYPHVKVFT